MNVEAKVFTPRWLQNDFEQEFIQDTFYADFTEEIFENELYQYEYISMYGYVPPVTDAMLYATSSPQNTPTSSINQSKKQASKENTNDSAAKRRFLF